MLERHQITTFSIYSIYSVYFFIGDAAQVIPKPGCNKYYEQHGWTTQPALTTHAQHEYTKCITFPEIVQLCVVVIWAAITQGGRGDRSPQIFLVHGGHHIKYPPPNIYSLKVKE